MLLAQNVSGRLELRCMPFTMIVIHYVNQVYYIADVMDFYASI